MKMLFISQWDMDLNGVFCGSAKKSFEQIECFNELGIKTEVYNNLKLKKESVISKLITRLPFTQVYNSIIYDNHINGYDAYYIRFLGGDYHLFRFIKKLRNNNKNAKILIEFPDVDYMAHFEKNLKNFPFFIKDKIFIKKISNLIDRSVTMYDAKYYKLFKNISILNGINTKKIKIIDNTDSFKQDVVNLGVVGTFQPVHGIDILLKSLGSYYKNNKGKKDIYLHIVGGGPQLELFQSIVKQYNLEKFVIFYGYLFGKELDDVYEKIDIGICELAPQRREYKVSSSLKSREYLARGLPLISAVKIDAFINKEFKYLLMIEPSELIDIDIIKQFYKNVYLDVININTIRQEIRNYAEKNIDIKETTKPIIDYLYSNK